MELLLFIASFVVFCFIVVARKDVESTPTFWLLLSSVHITPRLCFCNTSPYSAPKSRLIMSGQDLGRAYSQASWPSLTKGVLLTTWCQLRHKSQGKCGRYSLIVFIFRRNHYSYWNSASQEAAKHHLLIRNRNGIFVCSCFPVQPLLSLLPY